MSRKKENNEAKLLLKEALSEDILASLMEKKKALKEEELRRKELEEEKKRKEREEREKNKSFEELLKESQLNWKDFKWEHWNMSLFHKWSFYMVGYKSNFFTLFVKL